MNSVLGASGYADRALRGSAVRSGLSTPRCFVPRLNPFNPLRTNCQTLTRMNRRGSAPPLAWIFVVPCSGGSPCRLANKQHAARAPLGDLVKFIRLSHDEIRIFML
jgi:hypothetical protein